MPRWGGVLEPLAAGSASVWRSHGRELVLVLDVGAGTSDFSLFLVTQGHQKAPGHGAIPVAPVADAVRFAGDYVDDILLHQLLEKGHIDPGTTLGKQVQASVRLHGLRRIKERLFIEHRVDVPLTHDVVVSIEESEFLSSSDIRNFETQLHNRIRTFLESTAPELRATAREYYVGSDWWRPRPSDGGIVGEAVLGSPRRNRWLSSCTQSSARISKKVR